MKPSFCACCWTVVLAVVAGCTQSESTVDPQALVAHRERLLLDAEPDGAVGVLDAREMLVGPSADLADLPPADAAGTDEAPDHSKSQVIVVGRIGGVPNPWKQAQPDYPWSAGQAQFVMADAAAAAEIEGHGHVHDDPDHDCPFCAETANSDVVAVVRFGDEAGKVLRIDARELFQLVGEETVVVRGRPQMLGDAKDGVLVVEADGIYVRR